MSKNDQSQSEVLGKVSVMAKQEDHHSKRGAVLEGVSDITKIIEEQSIAVVGPRASYLGAYKSDELGFEPRSKVGVKSREDLRRMATESQQKYASHLAAKFDGGCAAPSLKG